MTLNGNSFLLAAYILSAGICMTVSAQSAMIALGDSNKNVYAYFSAVALMAALYLGATAYYYLAQSINLSVVALKLQVAAICISNPLLFKFFEIYTGKKNNRLFVLITFASIILLIINYFSPYSLRFINIERLPNLVLPWGEELNRHAGQFNPYRLYGLIGCIVFVWGLLQGFRLYKQGECSKAILLSLSILLIFLGGIWSTLIDFGWVNSFYILGFTFLSLVMMMNFQLAKEYQEFSNQIEKNNHDLALAASAFEVHDAILILGADLNIIRVNQSFEKFVGYQLEDLIGKSATIFDTEKCNVDFYHDLKQTLFLKGEWIGHAELKHISGSILPVFAKFTLVKDASGQVNNLVCIYSDLTEIKKKEEYLDHIQKTDQLTGLISRKYFVDQLAEFLNSTSDKNEWTTHVFVDT